MAKSEVLIEMPEFEKKYNLAMVKKIQFSHGRSRKGFFKGKAKTVFAY